MNKHIMLLSAPLKERIWGGTYFRDVLKRTDSDEKIGEMWSCSGHGCDSSIILNGYFKGQSLKDVFLNNRELFNNSMASEFPILIKLIATEDFLSVQVHPNDDYARRVENQYGKTEGWLMLDSKEDSSIIVGHNATNKEELIEYINNDDFDGLLRRVNVCKGEFYPIPAGTIHALGKHLVLLEIQQSSDVTYRFYDFHRKDKFGNERELHINKAVDVTSYKPYNETIHNCFEENIDTIWDNQYFKVCYREVKDQLLIENNNKYCIVTPIDNEIEINGLIIKMGESAIITSLVDSFKIKGEARLTITYSKQ